MIRKFIAFLAVVGGAFLLWMVFGVWTGMYAIYSVPPMTTDHPDGATFLISRDPGEPMFYSPDTPPPRKEEPSGKRRGGIGFGAAPKATRPVADRIILELPFIEWAYEKSLEAPESD
jgi:hypothetical protein